MLNSVRISRAGLGRMLKTLSLAANKDIPTKAVFYSSIPDVHVPSTSQVANDLDPTLAESATVPGFPGVTVGMIEKIQADMSKPTKHLQPVDTSTTVPVKPDSPAKSLSNFRADIDRIKKIYESPNGDVDFLQVQLMLESLAIDLFQHSRQDAIDSRSTSAKIQELGRLANTNDFQDLMNDWSRKFKSLLEQALEREAKEATFGHLDHSVKAHLLIQDQLTQRPILATSHIADAVAMTVFQVISAASSPYTKRGRVGSRVKQIESMLDNPSVFIHENSEAALAIAQTSDGPVAAHLEEEHPVGSREEDEDFEEDDNMTDAERAFHKSEKGPPRGMTESEDLEGGGDLNKLRHFKLTPVEQATVDIEAANRLSLPESERSPYAPRFPAQMAEDILMADMCSNIGDALATEFRAQHVPIIPPEEKKGDSLGKRSKFADSNILDQIPKKMFFRGHAVTSGELSVKPVYEYEGRPFTPQWDVMEMQVKIGASMLSLAKDAFNLSKLGVEEPAFQLLRVQEEKSTRRPRVIRINPTILRLASKGPNLQSFARKLPMLFPPYPWTHDVSRGGYWHQQASLVTGKTSSVRRLIINDALAKRQVPVVSEGINYLQSTGWRINETMLDFMKTLPPMISKSMIDSHHALPFNIAEALKGHTFYLPHFLDYRGRVYAISSYIHPAGDDAIRSIMSFAEPKPLGKTGLRWIKIQVTNMYGSEKGTFDERVSWAEDNLDNILASLRNPFDPLENENVDDLWWRKADKPLQFMAACHEYVNALRYPNPEEFPSVLPIYQDGTCNGLQYYAALGRDAEGAKAVNIVPNARPQDVYTEVLTQVVERVRLDASGNGGVTAAEVGYAKQLAAHPELLSRKVVKTPVMTSVYGVTLTGAANQVYNAIEGINDQANLIDKTKFKSHGYPLSVYLAQTIQKSITGLFPVATAIQDWLGVCVSLVTKSVADVMDETGTTMTWTTPLDLPIVQDYRVKPNKRVSSAFGHIQIKDDSKVTKVVGKKEKNAFAPNFIHSLDATHLFLTAMNCKTTDVTLASVHDSFWTHAATVDEMNYYLRHCFINLTSQALLEQLHEQMVFRYGDYWVPFSAADKLRIALAKKMSKTAPLTPPDQPTDAFTLWAQTPMTAPQMTTEELIAQSTKEPSSDESLKSDKKSSTLPSGPFVQFKDVIPPIPPLGSLDIQCVLKSEYFFN
uniref:DNA-directed RNA polymerase n=1 Tax=Phaffia rhodozyma TaxID=264483 RepID=A0A1C9UKZ0_PHARH|nr:mitochondrial RNA polymerase [Phaffia rhodozyma]